MKRQSRFPTLSTFSQPKDDSINIQLRISDLQDNNSIILNRIISSGIFPAWIPNTSLKADINVKLDYKSIRDDCKLTVDDILDLLVTVDSSMTKERRIFKFRLEWDSNFIDRNFFSSLDGDFLSGTLDIDVCLLVTPKNGVKRSYNSPTLKNTILWTESFEVVLEQHASLARVKRADLLGAFWRIRLTLPSDPTEWIPMDFNRVLSIEIDDGHYDLRQIRFAAYAEALFLAIDHVVSTPGALQIVATQSKKGSFLSEVENKLSYITGFDLRDVDKITELWPIRRYEYQVEMQKLVVESISMVETKSL